MTEKDDIRELLEKMSRYAGFFEAGPKERKELGVGAEFSRALKDGFGLQLRDLRVAYPDPPDLVVALGENLIGLEVTELVCSDAIKANKKADRDDPPVCRHWKAGEVRDALQERLADKDLCQLKGGPYDQYWVCVHTDEFELSPERVAEDLGQVPLGPFVQIDRAFLLFSHSPGSETYPLIEVSLVKHSP